MVRMLELRNPTHCEPPPAPGQTKDSFFDIEYRIQRSTDSGVSWTPRSGSTTGTIRMCCPQPSGPGEVIQIELVQLDLVSADGFHLRESPTRQSTGHTIYNPNAGGGYRIDSFFDVFTELSLDGGQTWTEGSNPLRVEIQQPGPTPTRTPTWGLVKMLYR
jgi:hypothetical protein